MSKFKVYDKVKWHYPEGEGCPDLQSAKKHITAVMDWLSENGHLTQEGKEIYGLGIDSNFSITSSMLTSKGKEIMEKNYSNLLKSIDYSSKINSKWVGKYLS